MRIHVTDVFVDDQRKALRFYTETLGFRVKHDIPVGEQAWITVVSEEAPKRSCCSSLLNTPRSVHSGRRWWRTGSPVPASRSMVGEIRKREAATTSRRTWMTRRRSAAVRRTGVQALLVRDRDTHDPLPYNLDYER